MKTIYLREVDNAINNSLPILSLKDARPVVRNFFWMGILSMLKEGAETKAQENELWQNLNL